MKQILIGIVVTSAIAMTGCASSGGVKSEADKGTIIDGKKILITDVSRTFDSFGEKMKLSELTKIYVKTPVFLDKIMPEKDVWYPQGADIVNERLSMYGIKSVDSLEAADSLLMFTIQGNASMQGAIKAAKASSLPTSEAVAVNVGAVAGGFIANGPSALVGGLIGLGFERDRYVIFSGRLVKKPKIVKGFIFENYEPSVKGEEVENSLTIKYKLEKGKEASDDVVLKMAIDQWLKKYVVFDVKPNTPVSAAVPAVVAVDEQAKK